MLYLTPGKFMADIQHLRIGPAGITMTGIVTDSGSPGLGLGLEKIVPEQVQRQ